MALRDDALSYETLFAQLEIDEAAHEATGATLTASQQATKAAFDLIQQQFALNGHFTHVYESGLNSVVLEVNNGKLDIDIVVTE